MLVSVILGAYNHAQYIEQAIHSVLSQSHKDIELIVIDDGSTDSTVDVIQRIKDSRLTYLVQKNRGPSYTYNKAFSLSRGEYVALMAADDMSLPYRLESQLDNLHKHHADVVLSRPELIDDDGHVVPQDNYPVFFAQRFVSTPQLYSILFFSGNFLCAPSALIRRDCFSQMGGFRLGLLQLQDFDFWIRCCIANKKLLLTETPCFQYRIRSDNENLSHDKNGRRTIVEMPLVYQDFFKNATYPLLRDAFPNSVRHDSEHSLESMKIDQSFLYLAHNNPLVRLIGVSNIFQYLENPIMFDLLENQYHFSLGDFFSQTQQIDIFNTALIKQLRGVIK